jgi:hypothetical protein
MSLSLLDNVSVTQTQYVSGLYAKGQGVAGIAAPVVGQEHHGAGRLPLYRVGQGDARRPWGIE